MPPPIQLAVVKDFTGGLNLSLDTFQVAPNQSPDLLNVDVGWQGGFRLRDGVNRWGGLMPAANPGPGPRPTIHQLIPFVTSQARGVLVQTDPNGSGGVPSGLVFGAGGAWTAPAGGKNGHATKRYRGATFNDYMYLVNADTSGAWRLDGDAVSGQAITEPVWNDDLENPTVSPSIGHFPTASLCAVHMGSVWVADTVEATVAYPNRVRWSHPNHPEDWVSYHYIDVDTGHDGDRITALVPFNDHLLVFKNRSVHAIYGSPPEGLQVVPVARSIGTATQETVVSSEEGVFFFDSASGPWLYQGRQPRWLFRDLEPLLRFEFDRTRTTDVRAGYARNRFWLSIPTTDGGTTTVVYDSLLGKYGAWVRYDLACTAFASVAVTDTEPTCLAVVNNAVVQLHTTVGVDYADPDNTPAVGRLYPSHYRTRWFDMGQPAVKKRWRRPEVVSKGNANAHVTVGHYRDYDPTVLVGSGTLGGPDAVGPTLVWGTGTWDTDVWGRDDGEYNRIDRLSPLGNSKSVALRFDGPADGTDWGVDALTVKWIPRKVRS